MTRLGSGHRMADIIGPAAWRGKTPREALSKHAFLRATSFLKDGERTQEMGSDGTVSQYTPLFSILLMVLLAVRGTQHRGLQGSQVGTIKNGLTQGL
eukprot:1939769-Pyramimonas_sp.AAC.1